MAEFVIHGWPNCTTATAGNGRISRPEWPRVPLELLYTFGGRKLLDLLLVLLLPLLAAGIYRAHKTAALVVVGGEAGGVLHNVNDI